MVILGLILVLVAVVAAVVLIYENNGADHQVAIHAFGGTWNVDAYWMAVVGAVVLLVAVLGVALLRSGSRRAARRRGERKALRRENAALSQQVAGGPPTRSGAGTDDVDSRPGAHEQPTTGYDPGHETTRN